MKQLLTYLFLFAVTVTPIFDATGDVVALFFVVDTPALVVRHIPFSITDADIPLTLDPVTGDLKNKAQIKVIAKQKFQQVKAARLEEIAAEEERLAEENLRQERIKLSVSDADLN